MSEPEHSIAGGARPTLQPPSGIRLVALDIDDTLVPWQGTMSRRVADAVRAVHAKGIEIVLATGRGVYDVVPVAEELGLDEVWALCSNGSVTARIARGDFSIHGTVTFDPRPLVAALRAIDPTAPIAIESSGLGFLTDGETFDFQAPHIIGEIGQLPEAVSFLTVASAHVPVEGFATLTAEHPVRAIPYIHDGWITVDIVHADAGKGAAVAALAASLGIEAGDCAAMGDYLNDIPMLEWAGWSVAMGQAPDEVKAVADVVVAASAQDGAAQALEAIAEALR